MQSEAEPAVFRSKTVDKTSALDMSLTKTAILCLFYAFHLLWSKKVAHFLFLE